VKSKNSLESTRRQFAAAVVALRRARDISGNQLAEAAAISRNTLHLIENKAANAQLDTVGRLATALDVDPCQFFEPSILPEPTTTRIETLRVCAACNIKSTRLKQKITQAQLTQSIGMPRGYIGYVERNAPDLTLDVLERIAHGLKTEISSLLAPAD
jgi:transcriptional regulator with XRE-family HTH domain